jgi:hypothetical protein
MELLSLAPQSQLVINAIETLEEILGQHKVKNMVARII